MNRSIFNAIILLVGTLFSTTAAQAQGTTYLSSLNQTSTGSHSVGSDSWLAAGFKTGNNANGYALNSVQLVMTDASGSPSGFSVMLYAKASFDGATLPGSSLGILNGSTNPSTAGIYTYAAASSLTLLPSTDYFIVVTAGTPVANGAYNWSTSAYPPNSSGWGAFNAVIYSSDRISSWYVTPYSGIAQFAINATPVPEPSAEMLLGLGGILLFGLVSSRRFTYFQ